jgi:transmembrane sensor
LITIMLNEPDRRQADLLFARANCGEPLVEAAAATELAQWSALDPERADYVRRLGNAQDFLQDSSDLLRDRLGQQPRAVPARSGSVVTWAGATACMAAVAGLLWWWNPVLDEYQGSTLIGERRPVELSDGSRITLNTASRMTATLRLRSRETVLLQGEALFEVSPSRWRPFSTRAGDVRIKVVGTTYNVRISRPGTRVSVVQGRVEVRASGRDDVFALAAGEMLDTANSVVTQTGRSELEALTAWREGRLIFDEKTVAEVLYEAGRYRSAPIRLADVAAGSSRISGVFSADNVEALLRMLPDVAPVTVTLAPDGAATVASRQAVSQAADGAFVAPVPVNAGIR